MPGRQALRLLVSMMLCTGGTQQLWTEGGGLQAGAAAGRMIWMMQGKYEMDLAFLRSEHSDAIQVRRRSMASRLSLSLSLVCVCVCVYVCVCMCVCVCVCVCVHSSVCLFLLGADCSACIVVSCSPSASDCAHACLSAQVVWGAEPSGKYDDTYYLPQSTCTEGRNYLLQLAYEKGVARGEQYIYFIYTEDDAELDEIIDFGLSQGVRTDEWRLNARFCCHMFSSFACAPLPPLVCQRVCPCLSSPQRSRPFPGPIPHIRGLSSQIPTSRGLPLQWLRLPRAS